MSKLKAANQPINMNSCGLYLISGIYADPRYGKEINYMNDATNFMVLLNPGQQASASIIERLKEDKFVYLCELPRGVGYGPMKKEDGNNSLHIWVRLVSVPENAPAPAKGIREIRVNPELFAGMIGTKKLAPAKDDTAIIRKAVAFLKSRGKFNKSTKILEEFMNGDAEANSKT